MIRVARKPVFGFPTRSDTNRAAQPQKIARDFKVIVILRREFSLKVICTKVDLSNCHFCNNVRDYEWTHKLTIQKHTL